LVNERFKTGAQVAFRLADATCPEWESIVAQIGSELIVSGEIVLMSDSGRQTDHFAIVQVSGIAAPLVVPVCKLHGQPHREAQRLTREGDKASGTRTT